MKDTMSAETCFPFLKLAEKYDFEDTRIQANAFVLPNFLTLYHTSDFKELSKDALVYYISHDELNRGLDESQVFYAVKEWLEHDRGRLEFAEEVLSHVRFMTITLDKLSEIANTELIDERKECRALVRKALTYQGKIFEKPLCSELQIKPRGKEGLFIIKSDGEKTTVEIHSCLHNHGCEPTRSQPDLKLLPHSMSAVQLNNFLFLFAVDSETLQPVSLRYDATTAEWLYLAPFPGRASEASAAAILGDDIYLLGGSCVSKSDSEGASPNGDAFLYKIASNKWVKLANVPQSTDWSAASASQENGYVYISGGGNKNRVTASVYAYDTKAKLWLSKPSMTQARLGHLMEAYEGKLYVLGGVTMKQHGEQTTNVNTIEIHDIVSEQWTVLEGQSLYICAGYSIMKNKTIFTLGGVRNLTSSEQKMYTQIFDIDEKRVATYGEELCDIECHDRDFVFCMFILPQLL